MMLGLINDPELCSVDKGVIIHHSQVLGAGAAAETSSL